MDNMLPSIPTTVPPSAESVSAPSLNLSKILVLSLAQIDTTTYRNTRKLDPDAIARLKVSISDVGLLSALNVACKDGQYYLIAGFHRYQAMVEMDIREVNCIVLEGEPDSLVTANLAENMVRTDLSLVEQIGAVKRLAVQFPDNISEIASRLGFSTKQVNERIALCRCEQEVIDALVDNKLTIAHAVVLSDLASAIQLSTLHKIITENWTVAVLKEKSGKVKISLDLAKFDQTECAVCPHNSSSHGQGDLFGESITAGVCSSINCFKNKSQAFLADKQAKLVQSYGEVVFMSAVDKNVITPLTQTALGESQIDVCRTCNDNVVLVNDNFHQDTFGLARKNICRNKKCYTDCAQVHSVSTAVPLSTDTNQTVPPVATTKQSPTPTTAPKSAQLSNKQTEDARKIMASYIGTLMAQDVEQNAVFYAVHQLLKRTGNKTPIASLALTDTRTLMEQVFTEFLTTFTPDHYDDFGHAFLALQADPTRLVIESWTPALLSDYTLAGIAQILSESGFKDAYINAYDKKQYIALQKSNKADLLAQVNAFDYVWRDYAPSAYINQFIKKETNA